MSDTTHADFARTWSPARNADEYAPANDDDE